MYKIPRYVSYKEKNEDYLILQSKLFNNEIKLTKQYFNELDTIQNEGCEHLDTELKSFLHEQDMLLSNDEILGCIKTIKDLSDKRLRLIILPTENCNFRCTYCYEEHRKEVMSKQQIDSIKNYINQNIDKFNNVVISWFGGEPTLCKDIIIDINNFVLQLKDKYNFTFTSDITTNGYILDVKMFNELYNCGINSYHITLDGWNHDKKRILPNGKGTLDVIVNNLKEISKLNYNFKVLLRNNVLKNDNDFTWYDYLKENFDGDNRFCVYVRAVSDFGGERVHELEDMISADELSILKKHNEYIKSIGLNLYSNELDGEVSPVICYAGYKYSFVIRPNGNIAKCSIQLDHPLNYVGHIDSDNGVIIDDDKNKLWYDLNINEGCMNCAEVGKCMNLKCPSKRVFKNDYTVKTCE